MFIRAGSVVRTLPPSTSALPASSLLFWPSGTTWEQSDETSEPCENMGCLRRILDRHIRDSNLCPTGPYFGGSHSALELLRGDNHSTCLRGSNTVQLVEAEPWHGESTSKPRTFLIPTLLQKKSSLVLRRAYSTEVPEQVH